MPLRIGFALNVASRAERRADIAETYREAIQTVVAAERLGADSVWVGQQHFDTTAGPIPSPLVFLAAAAAQTSSIRLGTGVTTLPLEDPLRLAEDAATLDVLAGGRLELGLAVGGANTEGFRAFGLDPVDRHGLFEQKLARFLEAIDGDALVPGAAGPHLYPPLPRFRARVWQGTASLDKAVAAATRGLGLQLGTFYDDPETGQAPKIRAYLDEWRRVQAGTPRVAVFRFVYLGASRQEVLDRVAPFVATRLATLVRHAHEGGVRVLDGLSPEQYLDRVALYGAPEDVAARLALDPAVSSATDLVANFSYGQEYSAAETEQRLGTLLTEVVPHVRSAGV